MIWLVPLTSHFYHINLFGKSVLGRHIIVARTSSMSISAFISIFLTVSVTLAIILVNWIPIEEFLYLLIFPVYFAALYFRKRIYLIPLLITVITSIYVTYNITKLFYPSLETILLFVMVIVLTAEMSRYSLFARIRAEENLRESRQRYRELYEGSLDGYAIVDMDGKIIKCNSSFKKMVGYTDEELTNLTFYDITPAKWHSYETQVIENEVMQYGHSDLYEKEYICKDGTIIPIEIRTYLLKNHNGEVDGFWAVVRNITTRRQTEKELLDSRAFYHSLVENLPQCIFRKDLEGHFTFANQRFCEELGKTLDEIIGKTDADFFPLELAQKYRVDDLKIIETGEILETVEEHQPPTGEKLYVQVVKTPVRNENGDIIGVQGIFWDITERKKTEKALQQAKNLWEKTFDAVPDLISIIDKDYTILQVNQAMAQRLKKSPAELIGLKCYECFHGTSEHPDYCPHAKLLEDCLEHVEEYHEDYLNGDFLVTTSPLFDSKQELIGSVHVARDITELKKADREIRESHDLVEEVEKFAHIGFWKADLNHNTLLWSDEIYKIFGLDRESFDHKRNTFYSLIHPDDRERVMHSLQNAIQNNETYSVEHRIVRKDGSIRWLNEHAKILRDENGTSYQLIGLVHDITERKILEEQLRQSQKMEAIGQLAGGIAHDFNNLLSTIFGYCELIINEMDITHPTYKYIREINKAGERAASLTRQLLAFSRKQVLQPKVLNLNSLIFDMDKMLQRIIGENIDFISLPASNIGSIKADPGQIEQVLLNLIINARDAMPKGGKIILETQNIDVDEDYAKTHTDLKPGTYIQLTITDSGCGIDKATMNHIFEPFYTTKTKGKGTGLGLSIVYGIVKQSGGNIFVYSEIGKGTTFKIFFPRVEKSKEKPEKEIESIPSLQGSETILIVEDDELVRDMVVSVLKEYGYTTIETKSVAEALQTCEYHEGPIHALLTDIILPEKSGFELAEQIIQSREETKVLYMSGYTNNTLINEGIIDMEADFIQKPFTPNSLLRKIRQILTPSSLSSK